MSSHEVEHARHMLEQIAANHGWDTDSARAAESVASHIRRFWPPDLRRRLMEAVNKGECSLSPLAAAALQRV